METMIFAHNITFAILIPWEIRKVNRLRVEKGWLMCKM